MGIPSLHARHLIVATHLERRMWREPTEAENIKSAREKDASAAARSAIRRQPTQRRPSRHSSARARSNVLSSLHSHIIDEISRGIAEPQLSVRSPVLNLGVSEDGLDLDSSRREALNRSSMRLGGQPPTRSVEPHPKSYRFQSPTSHSHPGGWATVSPLPLIPRSSRLRRRNHDPPPYIPSVLLRDYRTGSGRDRPHRESAIDGLGDRQRSLSPSVERDSDDAWETLLSTITPDTTLPSADTSFSSTSAATTNPRRNPSSRSLGTTSQTQPFSRAIRLALDSYPDHLNPCDYSSDDEDTPVNYHRMIGPGPRLSLRRSPGTSSTMSNHPPIPTISFSFSDSGDSDLQQMQAILDRLARREDIPDDWWAGAGLSRTMGRGLSASAEDNDTNRAE
ncbi:uncharacterized protein N7477_008168 [Penicillium maclennaniae]|uniref:uncharacterized protein n=1 Tax=Penicillium maclennaniae TaxID=1343394 RepID=UPI00253FD746|nr:uncharacterized protein N7477_008168 [Penicillium maclennaniae]KAJ5665720.1 hypothetical protein N7477_008168 [Penicillium maclennaniae]